jgi:CRP-like cAMP-binding protein
MKVIDIYWDHPSLQDYRRYVPQGQYLFQEGDEATEMYIILQGIVELEASFEGSMTPIGLVEAGQFLGEKTALVDTPYKRAFSSKAKTDLKLVALKWYDLLTVQAKNPKIITDILSHMFLIAAERLDRANQLNRILRSSKNVERIVRFIQYYAHHNGIPGSSGEEFQLPVNTIRYYVDIPPQQIEECLEELRTHGLLKRGEAETYTITNEKKLLDFIRPLSKYIANGFYEELEAVP